MPRMHSSKPPIGIPVIQRDLMNNPHAPHCVFSLPPMGAVASFGAALQES
jgi:hypothetical protein